MRLYVSVFGIATLALVMTGCEEELLNGTISGHVKDDGQNVSGAFVLLLEEGQMVQGNMPLSNASITNNAGNYTIYAVTPNKNYYVAAVKDNDGNLAYTPGVDALGYYGTYNSLTHIWIPATVSIGSGENKTGININEMYVMPVP